MLKHSAGILFYRFRERNLEVFLVHPGGPFWARKDAAAWSIPKGEFEEGEDPLNAAKRELAEERGIHLDSPLIDLGVLTQTSRKIVHIWAACQDIEPSSITSNTFTLEWPPRSGKLEEFPEIDRAAWFSTRVARDKLHKGQVDFIDKLREALGLPPEDDDANKRK
jgi:predicted NUDIX family NTP pyrophosphohydrolase